MKNYFDASFKLSLSLLVTEIRASFSYFGFSVEMVKKC